MLQQLETLLQASPKVTSFQVMDHDAIDEENFLLKLRCDLASGHTLQIRLRSVEGYLRYSYQEFADKPLRRWDNAPHFSHLATLPHHYHDHHGVVMESALMGDPTTDLEQVLDTL